MEFSEALKYNSQCLFSPDGKYIASILNHRLIIRNVESLQVTNLFTNCDNIHTIEWSKDSNFLLCTIPARSVVQVWDITDSNWKCHIQEAYGVVSACFSPSGEYILVSTKYNLRVSVWCLTQEKSRALGYIKNPKNHSRGISFSPNGILLAVAERENGKDSVSIIRIDDWSPVCNFQVSTIDIADLKWSPNSLYLCISDSVLEYKIQIYSLDGTFIKEYSPSNDNLLGVKKFTWEPKGKYIAIGSHDSKIRLMKNKTWKIIAEFYHKSDINQDCFILQEVQNDKTFKFEYAQISAPIRISKSNNLEKRGIGMIEFSHDGKYICSKSDEFPNVLWIWKVENLTLHSLVINLKPIKKYQWEPYSNRIVFCSGDRKLYMWTEEGCSFAEVPDKNNFNVHSVTWNFDGKVLLLKNENDFCCCFDV
eukprot:gene11672-4908_t